MLNDVRERCDAIEESYEFLLGYAAQGVPGGEDEKVRGFLQIAAEALDGLAESYRMVVRTDHLEPAETYEAFLDVLERDARDSLAAAIRLVLAQPRISSQLIDNLNASIHLRALLTDLFLMDEALKARASDEGTLAGRP